MLIQYGGKERRPVSPGAQSAWPAAKIKGASQKGLAPGKDLRRL
jgi:hypothetical protein